MTAHQTCLVDLVTVINAILRSTQTREKLQCLYENLISNNFCRTAVQKKIWFVNWSFTPNTLGTRGFSRMRRKFLVLAEGRHIFGRRPKPQEKPLAQSGAFNCPHWPLSFSYRITFTPIRLKVSNCAHVGQHVKKCPKTHVILRKTSSSLKFIALRAIMTGSHRSSP